MRGRVFIILLSLAGLGLPANLFSYNDDSTHYELTQEVVDFYSAASGRVFSSEERETIARGAVAEDTPPRWVNHFYDPAHNEPWLARYFGTAKAETAFAAAKSSFGIDRTYTAKDWSQNESAQNKYQAYKGNRTFQRALYEYTQGNKKEALYTLGFILHLIEDMTVPDHTRGDTHWENGLTDDPGSPYEKWAETLTRSTNLTIAQNLVRQKVKPIQVDSLNQVFDSIASYSNNNFFSQDTINDSRFSQPAIVDDGTFLYHQSDNFKLAIYDTKEEKRILTIKDNSILQGYWSRLSPLAVRAGAGIMDYFFREVERIEKENVVLENPTSWSKRLAGGFVVSPYGEVNRAERAATTVKALAVSLGDAAQQVSGSVGAAAKSAFTDVWQKVKLAALVAPANPHPTLSLEGRGDSFTPPLTPPQRGGEQQGQVLGEQVVAAGGITNNQTPITKKEEEPSSRGDADVIASGAQAKRSNLNNAQSVKKIASSPALREGRGPRNDNPAGGPEPEVEQRDSSSAARNDGLDSPAESADSLQNDSVAPSGTTPNPSLPRRGTAGPSFIGIFAPAPAVSNTTPAPPQGGGDSDTPPTPDTIPPTTWITILSATTTAPSFLIQWSGTDNIQPTPASYDIQYQPLTLTLSPEGRGDSLFNPIFIFTDWLDWLLATTTASSYFTGQDEKTYGFRSRARDQEGNESTYPSSAETYTYLNLSVPSTPTITSHQNNQTIIYGDDVASTTDGVQITLAGTADPSDAINLTYSSSEAATTTATTTASTLGAWSKQLTLSEGANTITLQSQEADGDISSSTSITLNLNTAPSTITDLAVSSASTTASSTALVWTTPNQANLQIASSSAYYDVRYLAGASCAITETSFGSLSQASNPPAPSAINGMAESFTITNLADNTNYCFGLKTHNGLRFSDLSNITTITLPSSHGTDIAQIATSTNADWGWNNIGEWWKTAQSFQPTRSSINGFEFTACRRYPDGYNTPGLRVILCRGLPSTNYLGGCDSGNVANNVLYRKDYSSAETEALMPFCGGWAGVARRLPPVLSFSFNAVALTPGQAYSIILSATGGAQMQVFTSSYQADSNPYANGAIYYQDDNTWFKEKVGADWYFKTVY